MRSIIAAEGDVARFGPTAQHRACQPQRYDGRARSHRSCRGARGSRLVLASCTRIFCFVDRVRIFGTLRLIGSSRALLDFLFKHMTRPAFIYRHRWQAGTLMMWDNRCVVHYAEGGYEGHRRLMYRTTLAGERPAA